MVLTYCEKKKCSSDQGTPLTLKAEGQEFANILRSLKNLGPLSTCPLMHYY